MRPLVNERASLVASEPAIEKQNSPSSDAPDRDGRRRRGDRRQRAILDAARDLFIRHGYRGTTLEAIIAQAGGSRETIYRVFGGKRGLFGAIITNVGERLAGSIVEPEALTLAPRAALTRIGLQLVAIWQSEEGSAMNRVVVSEGLEAPEIVDSWYQGGVKLSVAALARYLSSQRESGHLDIADPELTARQFVMLLIGEMALPLIARDTAPDTIEARVCRCVDLILKAHEPHT